LVQVIKYETYHDSGTLLNLTRTFQARQRHRNLTNNSLQLWFVSCCGRPSRIATLVRLPTTSTPCYVGLFA
jgi:hypothetical protein